MRASMAYFAGAGTVMAAIAAGLGGGLMMGNIMNPKTVDRGAEMTRLEQHRSAQPIQAANKTLEPVPFLVAPQPPASDTTVAAAPAPAEPQKEVANSTPAPSPQPDPAAAKPVEAAAAKPAEAAPPQSQPAQPVAREQASAPEDAMAKTRDNEMRRADDRRRIERRQQWTERRRHPQRQEQELRAVEDKVREVSETRRDYEPEPARIEMPRIRLFGPE